MAHAHGDGQVAVPRRTRRLLTSVSVVLAIVTLLGVVLLRSPGDVGKRTGPDIGLISRIYDATVVSTRKGPCANTTAADRVRCVNVRFRLNQGPDKHKTTSIDFPESPTTPKLNKGDDVVLSYEPRAEPGFQYQFSDRQRRPVLLWLAVIFAVAVVALGRLRGIAALVGLAASIVVLLAFVLPAILDGRSPVLVAVFGASAIAYLALYLANGFNARTTVALLGTLGALALTVLLASVFTSLAQLSGFASEEALLVKIGQHGLDLSGVVLGGMVIGALGALDDMTVTQAAAVWELRSANPQLTRSSIFGSAMRIGRDHVASTVNTLALAYAGAALPLLILFVQSRQSLGAVANGETVATEILSALVGSIGIVASVPLTTWLAARVVGEPGTTGRRRGRPPPTRRPQPHAPVPDTESEFWDGPSDEYPPLSRAPAPRAREPD
ncbi:MAG TPA: YibE/F family protein [Acidimicrobiia bacterium]